MQKIKRITKALFKRMALRLTRLRAVGFGTTMFSTIFTTKIPTPGLNRTKKPLNRVIYSLGVGSIKFGLFSERWGRINILYSVLRSWGQKRNTRGKEVIKIQYTVS